MTNDNRTMAEKRVASLLSATICEELGQIPKVSITREELMALAQTDARKRRMKTLRYVGVAAVVLLVCAALLRMAYPSFFCPADADKERQKIEKQSVDTLVIQEDRDNWRQGTDKIQTADWQTVMQYKTRYPQLFVPAYVPKGFAFVRLKVETKGKTVLASEFLFQNKSATAITITQAVGDGQEIKVLQNAETFQVGQEKIYVVRAGEKVSIASLARGAYVITLSGQFSEQNIEKMISALQ